MTYNIDELDDDYDYTEEEEDAPVSAPNNHKQSENMFYKAQKDHEAAVRAGLDASNILKNYLSAGQITQKQYDIIENSTGLAPTKKEFKVFGPREKKPFCIDKNFKTINIQSLDKFKALDFVCRRFKLVKGNLVAVVAAGGSGKTLFLQYFAVCVAAGIKLFGTFDVTKGKVLHIDQEQSERLTNVRYSRIAKALNVNTVGNIERVVLPRIDIQNNNIEEVQEQLVDVFKNYSVVIVDSLKKLSNADENTADIEIVVNMLRVAAEKSNALVLMIHHMGKAKGKSIQSGRGHSSIYDSVDMQIDLQHEANDPSGMVELECVKNREGAVFNGLKYQFRDEGDRHPGQDCHEKLVFELIQDEVSTTEKKSDVKVKILEVLKTGERNLSSLFSEIKGDRNAYNKALEDLLSGEDQLITERTGAKGSRLFSITPAGTNYLSYENNGEVQ